jgi:hypothetical protein
VKQHPIPHNILDIEFKLFGKLTLKQAAYIAIGVVTGGIFLLLRANGAIPDILAWPAFLILSGIGLFVGLVPINDQTADTLIANYFKAIGSPTRRVWKNAQFNERLEVIKESKDAAAGVDDTSNQQHDKPALGGADIVGSTTAGNPMTENSNNEIASLDEEEKQKMDYFENLSKQTESSTTIPSTGETERQYAERASARDETTIPRETKELLLKNRAAMKQGASQMETEPTPTQKQTNNNQLVYASFSMGDLKVVPLQFKREANIPYLQFVDSNNHPVPNSIVVIKDSNGTTVQAHRTNSDGLIVPTRPLTQGNYVIEIQSDKQKFPIVQYVADGAILDAIQVKAI